MNLLELLKNPEGKTLEFKRDLSSPAGVLRSVVAFANTAGGTLLLGVEDATRHVRGVSDPLALEERLASLISDSIRPREFARRVAAVGKPKSSQRASSAELDSLFSALQHRAFRGEL